MSQKGVLAFNINPVGLGSHSVRGPGRRGDVKGEKAVIQMRLIL